VSQNTGRYLYAIVASAEDRSCGSIGINGGLVYSISDGRVAAVVSDVPDQKIRPERRNLAAQQEVLKRLMQESSPLPAVFGIIADGPGAIREILTRNQKAFLDQLNRVVGKVEMVLRVAWDVPNIFEHIVNTHPELRVTRDRFFGNNREPSRENKLEVGRMFERVLDEDRETYTIMVEEILLPRCFEIKRNPPRNEREVTNLACLVDCGEHKGFEAGVFEAAGLFDNNFALDYTGPWAPHNFAELEFQL